jgi:hypothetical protein
MPGHFVAALHAYPEFCCHPERAPEVWITGGVSQDVLNVANPAAVQFAKNIITELCAIFPYPYFHIGGDECPTTQWESNALCQAKLKELGKTSYRALQTEFIREINEHLGTLGKKIFCWNESITDNGADLDLMKKSGATIMCWNPCQSGAAKAASLGLNAIITEWGSGCYYINRRQSNDYGEPTGAGGGGDDVYSTYNYVPVPSNVSSQAAKYYIGVQGTFWTEHVSSNEYLEYAALPRFMCIAEAGWTPQEQKNWNSFVKRMTVDTKMLDLGGYIYARHWMDDYVPRQAPASILADGCQVTFTNKSADRGQCLRDDNGTLNGQGSECTKWTLEAASGENMFYIRSNVSGKYLYAANGNSGTMVQLSDGQKSVWTFDTATSPGYVAICYNSTSGNAINNNVSNTTKTRLFAHGSGNGASFWAVDSESSDNLKDGETGVLVYNYYYRGISVAKKEFHLTSGTEYPSFTEYIPNGYAATSLTPLSGKVHLKNEIKEIVVEKIPETGRYYRFNNTVTKTNLSTDASTEFTYSTRGNGQNTIFYFSDTHLLAYDRGLYLNGANLVESLDDAANISILPSAAKTQDMCNIISNESDYLRIQTDTSKVNSVGDKTKASKAKAYDFFPRYVLSLPVVVDASGWATFSASSPVIIPEGCVAYIADNYIASTATIVLKPIQAGGTIAANTGILLKTTPSTTVELTITEKGNAYDENLFYPSVAQTLVPTDANAYVLSYANGVASFVKQSKDNTSFSAHSAWLNINATDAPQSISISIPGDETSISSTTIVPQSVNSIYNTKGQPLRVPQNGVNIINGKKVVVR